MTISVKYNSILVDISLTPWRISVSSFSRRRISVSSVIKQVPEIQIIYFTSYYLNPLPMFEEFSHLKSLGENQSLPHTMKAGKASFLSHHHLHLPDFLAARSQVHGLDSVYLKQELVTQRRWDSAKSFLVAKSISWIAGAAMTAAFIQHPTLAVLAVGTLVLCDILMGNWLWSWMPRLQTWFSTHLVMVSKSTDLQKLPLSA